MINEILLRRKNKITLDELPVPRDVFGNIIENTLHNENYVISIMKNIEGLGYTLSDELFKKLCCYPVVTLKEFYFELVNKLRSLLGADVEYKPFYPNFPEQVIALDECETYMNAIVHYLSGGQWKPDYQVDARFPLINNSKAIVLEYGTMDDLKEIFNNLISSKTSLSKQDKDDMNAIFTLIGVDIKNLPDEIPFKENMITVAEMFCFPILYENETKEFMNRYFKTATDVLRFITALSEGDISLANNTEYKSLKRPMRKLILSVLNSCGNLKEDMYSYKEQWKRVGERLHPGEYPEYKNAYETFKALRENEDIVVFDNKFNTLMDSYGNAYSVDKQCIADDVVDLLKTRPGVFARKLDFVLRKIKRTCVLNGFSEVVDQVPVPTLIQLMIHFKHRHENGKMRVFFPKGAVSKVYAVKNELPEIPKTTCDIVCGFCYDSIIRQLQTKTHMGKVYLSDTFKGFCVPHSQRSTSSGMKIVARNSKFSFEKNFIRLFIRWCNEIYKDSKGIEHEDSTDIDLSCSFLDDSFCELDHISFTKLRNEYSVHSGDFTNAPRPNGASEFIDIDINAAANAGVKYVAIQVYGYTDSPFNKLEDLTFGWMEREDLSSGEVFEPSTVKNRINLSNQTRCGLPMILDVKNKEIIWADIDFNDNKRFPRSVENNISTASMIVNGIVNSDNMMMYDLVEMNIEARGERTEDRNSADVIFDTNTEKPFEVIHTIIKNDKDEIIEEKEEKKVKDNVRIITPYDIDVFMGELL